MGQLGFCMMEAQNETARLAHCSKEEAELLLFDMMKELIGEDKQRKQWWKFAFTK